MNLESISRGFNSSTVHFRESELANVRVCNEFANDGFNSTKVHFRAIAYLLCTCRTSLMELAAKGKGKGGSKNSSFRRDPCVTSTCTFSVNVYLISNRPR